MLNTKLLLTHSACLTLCFAHSLIAETSPSAAPQIQVELADLKDIRPNGKEPGKLEVTVKISGAEFSADAKGYRIALTKAVDNTGLDLLLPESAAAEFRPPAVKTFVLKLKSPVRKAGSVSEISGNVEVSAPRNDPTATVTETRFRKNTGKPLKSEVLKSAAIEITPWTPEQYNALSKKKEADELQQSEVKEREAIKAAETRLTGVDRDKEIARLRASFASRRDTQAFGHQMGFSNAAKPNDIVFSIEDPGKKLVGIEFHDAMDRAIRTAGSSESYRQRGSEVERTRTYHFQSPLPADAKLLIFVATTQSLSKTPFTLTNMALP
jgi:hypothetical protein